MKQRTTGKRIASLMLVLLMLLSWLPGGVAAASATDLQAIERPAGLSIVEDYDDYFGDAWLEKLELPDTVTVTLANGTKTDVLVTWDASSLDPRTPGYYFLPGSIALPVGVTNGANLEVAITVQVREKSNLLTNGSFESGNSGWGIGSSSKNKGTPAAEGDYALQVRSSSSGMSSYNMLFPSNTNQTALATKVAQLGAGQYYVGVQVRDYLASGETAHTDALQAYIRMGYKNDASASSSSSKGNTAAVTINSDSYVTVGGVFEMTGEEVWLRPDLYLKSSTKFASQWILVDAFEFIPLKVALEAEPATITQITSQIQSRFVTLNYDKYAGADWQEALGLPKTVEVLTDNGSTATVEITWDYSALDVSKQGKYTLTGTIAASAFPNPKGLTVQQNIYVRTAENLFANPSFESGKTDWSIGSSSVNNGTPAAVGDYALQVRSSSSSVSSYNMLFPTNAQQTALLEKITALGAGQYYLGAQVRDYLASGETAHTDALQAYFRFSYKTDVNATSSSSKGNTEAVTINSDSYVTVGGMYEMTGEEAWIRPDLYIKSSTKFTSQWILVDDMQFFPLNVLIPFGEEPADITEIIEEIPVRAVVQNYDQYVGEDWQDKLNLPAAVTVNTGNGVRAKVNVIWDYSGLNISHIGKYVLIGKLDDSAYPNPNNLTVSQTIYVREAKNLFENPSFESGKTGWSYSNTFKANAVPAALGKYAFGVRSSSSEMSSYNMMFPSGTYQTLLAEKVTAEGAGQYYIGAQVRDYLEDGEIAHTDALKAYIRVNYKTDPDATSSSLLGSSKEITLSDEGYATTGGVFEMTGSEVWLRPDLYIKSSTKFTAQWILVDDMQFIPLNVEIQTYDGAADEVLTVIPDRNIILNYPDYIDGYTTADLMFPEAVEVRSTTGEIVKVGIKWNYEALDLTTLGTYTLTGVLDDMRLSNSKGITVDQVVHVVEYQNLMFNGGFEDGDTNWNKSGQLSAAAATKIRLEGDYSLKLEFGRMDNYVTDIYKEISIQAFYSAKMGSVGQSVAATGAGRYYFGIWAQGTETSDDCSMHVKLVYKNMEKGDASNGITTGKMTLSATEFKQSGGLIDLPGDIYWTRMDLYFHGSVSQLRNSELYLDKAELVPLNVEVPNMTDIIDCEDVADIYVHEGGTTADLKLPAQLEILLKNGQRLNLKVTWDLSALDLNKPGVQTVTGTLDLEDEYRNPKKFTPTAKITIRKKGEDLRQTIYLSNAGSEDNDGLSPEAPKQDVTKIATYLKQGYNVRLKRGDTWYLPTAGLSFQGIYGTEDAPLVVGAYGEGDELPVIAFMLKIEDSQWELVDEKRNVYAVDVSSLGQKNGISVHRCFVNDEAYCHKNRTNYVSLDEEEYCSYGGMLYIRPKAGEKPENVEVTPYGKGGKRITITDSSYLTFEYLHIQGASAINTLIYINAPTKYIKLQYCSITHCNYYIIVMEAADERVNYRPEISNCFIDAMYSVEEGINSGTGSGAGHWSAHLTEGICMRDGVEEAWIHHNHIRNMSHAFIAIESLKADRLTNYKIRGIFNCVIEDNIMEGGNVKYTRALNLAGGAPNAAGLIMSRDNTVRRNICYDMSTSNHLYGENILVYGNVFSYVHCAYREDGTRWDGKSAQPYAFDSIDPGVLSGAIIANNTFYNLSSAVAFYGPTTMEKYDNIVVNNLVVNWTSDDRAVYSTAGAFYDNTGGINYFMNNAVYSTEGRIDHFVVDGVSYRTEDVNGTKTGFSGNLYGDPKFVNADLSQMVYGARLDFTLSGESPFRYAGLSINDSIYKKTTAWDRLVAEYTDLNGTAYLAESPSIGAISFSERIGGDVVSVGTLEDVRVRIGASFESLPLPDTVGAVNDQGIDVVLLIDWISEGFDSSKDGTVTLTGTLRNGPHTQLNVEGKTVSVNVQLIDKLEMKDVVTTLNSVTVRYKTPYEEALMQLPQVLHVVEEYGFEEDLPVTWTCDNYNPEKPDIYTFKCILPEERITNARDFKLEVEVRVMEEIFRGTELLVNPNFIEGTSASPWQMGWGQGSFKVTTDPEYLYPGATGAAIVTEKGRYGSVQQEITGQVKMMGDGKYLFRCYMRSYEHLEVLDSSYACVSVTTPTGVYYERCHAQVDIGNEWVEFTMIMNLHSVEEATKVMFHTSTGKTAADSYKSYVISGCSFIYLGATDEEVEASLDCIDLNWNAIRGENEFAKDVTKDLILPDRCGEASTITWSSSDESAISSTGKVTMGRLPKTVILTATITYGEMTTKKEFTITVPRNADLPEFTGALSGEQTVKVGETVDVVISLTAQKTDAFNAWRFTLSFNTGSLEYVGISDGSAVEIDGGKLVISGMGTQRPITDTITVTFRAKKAGVTDIKLVTFEMDNDPDASLDSLPKMTITNKSATVTIEKIAEAQTPADGGQDNAIVWVIIGIAAAMLLCGGAVALILIKKKKDPAEKVTSEAQ